MMRRLGWIFPLILALSLLPLAVFAQQEGTKTPPPASPGATMEEHQHGGMQGGMHGGKEGGMQGGMKHNMMQKCKEMGAKHDKAMADIKAMDTQLDEKVAAMHAAKGEKKSSAMEAVINELVAQRKAMREKFEDVQGQKMCSMMGQGGRMKGGKGHMGHGMKGGMSGECPMMEQGHGTREGAPETGAKEGTGT